MHKIICLLVLATILTGILSACSKEQPKSMIQAKRRLEKYIEPENVEPAGGVVDLSEGPKLNYNRNFGPKNLNFDFKIINPY